MSIAIRYQDSECLFHRLTLNKIYNEVKGKVHAKIQTHDIYPKYLKILSN